MKVLVACEFSGIVRDAFIGAGHDATSCDLLPSEAPGPHYCGDVGNIIGDGFDMVIAFPPCTYLCSMGVWWNHKRPERWRETDSAERFFMTFADSAAPRVAIENPVGIMSTRYRKPDQVIQPWQYGHTANKPTCLWLKGLPKLFPTQIVDRGKFYIKSNGNRMSVWSHKTSGTDKAKRARIASRTFAGIADAMAKQWTGANPYQPDLFA